MSLSDVDVDVVVAVHDLARRVDRTVLSALCGADVHGVLPSGHRVRVTVVAHELAVHDVRAVVEAGLKGGTAYLGAHVRYLEVRDGLRSPAGPFNAGLMAADGRFVSIIGSDDRYAEGALAGWARLADELGSAWLMPRLETDTGEHIPTPRTRPGRSRDLDLVLDRLAYRTAPLGLLRREVLVELGLLPPADSSPEWQERLSGRGEERQERLSGREGPLTPGLATGEDIELSLRLATSGERIDYAVALPPYVIGTGTHPADQPHDRVTHARRPVADELAAHARLLDLRWVRALPEPARRAIVVKTLRIHVLAAVRRRPAALDWAAGETEWLQELTRDLLAMAPDAEHALHRADRDLLDALLVARSTDDLAAASRHRAQAGRWDILLTPRPQHNLDPESTVRQHLDTAATVALGRARDALERRPGARHTGKALHQPARPRVLVLSFSPIAADVRVLKQVRHLSAEFDVVTCGYGPAPEGVTAHVRVPDDRQNRLDGRLITAHAYHAAYRAQAGVRWVLAHVRPDTADVVLANDLDAVPLALALRPRAGVHADLHEYFPRLHEEHEAWMRRISPYQEWLCRRFLPRCAAVTTVSHRIAEEYAEQFGIGVGVVTNAAPYADLSPGPVRSPLRLVHSGACLRNRDLHVMVDAVSAAAQDGAGVTLDLYLTPNDPGYLQELRERAGLAGGIVTVHDPVPYADLLTTLHRYDVGVHVLPPVSFNNANALPNKIFDYVQARLGLLVGPSPEMARVVHEHSLGVVATAFDARAVAAAVARLDEATVTAYKQAADAAAHQLSDAEQSRRWVESVRRMAAR
ncbi:hypothetical protein GCM10011366_12380 [Ornithinimicrobium tianjinense]|uniref:Glycosyltransferase subfamily 4-like N-terminal domain-containing protein n=1 Tax=Ornithinimicrobium tianjinense TaxID=1195761 RepID=A0A917F4M6_9MICO|nr:glycosyltransferase [Ornithinimicrobium tianjinense]GGF46175.1 hypothetical protein GCM10011366_12380 [Ornithinimicrobium tianjinense]